MLWREDYAPNRSVCHFGLTEIAIPAALAFAGDALGIGGAAAGAAGLGEAALGGAALGGAEALGAGGAALGGIDALAGAAGGAAAGGAAAGGAGGLSSLGLGGGLGELAGAGAAAADPLAAAGGAAAGGGQGGFLSSLGTGALNSITKNPLGLAAAGVGLGMNLFGGNKGPTPGNLNTLQGEAGTLLGQGNDLASYLSKGTLPPGIQSAVTQGTDSARARIISNYASRGMPTDPTQNSALAAELSALDQQAAITTSQIGQQLLTSGMSEIGLSQQILNQLINFDTQQSKATGDAISNFAKAIGGSQGGINLKLA